MKTLLLFRTTFCVNFFFCKFAFWTTCLQIGFENNFFLNCCSLPFLMDNFLATCRCGWIKLCKLSFQTRAVESKFKSNPIFPIFLIFSDVVGGSRW